MSQYLTKIVKYFWCTIKLYSLTDWNLTISHFLKWHFKSGMIFARTIQINPSLIIDLLQPSMIKGGH